MTKHPSRGRLIPRRALALLAFPLSGQLIAQGITAFPFDPTFAHTYEACFAVGRDGTAGGSVKVGFDEYPALKPPMGAVRVLARLPGDEQSWVHAVDTAATAVGTSLRIDWSSGSGVIVYQAARWNAGVVEDLTANVVSGPAWRLEVAHDVNRFGSIVGRATDPSTGLARAFLFQSGTLTDLGPLPGWGPQSESWAHALNAADQIVGVHQPYGALRQAFLWTAGTWRSLHDPSVLRGGYSEPFDINGRGEACGAGFLIPNGHTRPILWDSSGFATPLGSLGGPEGIARALNDRGDVVGYAIDALSRPRGFLYRNGTMVDLNTLIPANTGIVVLDAHDINEDGWIAATGEIHGSARGLILVPDACTGFFEVFGGSCPPSGAVRPALVGFGCPRAGSDLRLELQRAPANTAGLLVFGTGRGTILLPGNCLAQTLPLLPVTLPLQTSRTSPLGGTWHLNTTFPTSTPPGDVFLQGILLDPVQVGSFVVTNPLRIAIR
ncbi:MAG: hypothetical protein H6834_09750 [Planctomycetes bacterium]|nr:hypothetical protein [Planctomycetota bacterium]